MSSGHGMIKDGDKNTMDLKWIEPESRWVMKSLFRRDFDAFTDEARRAVNWMVLASDLLGIWVILSIL